MKNFSDYLRSIGRCFSPGVQGHLDYIEWCKIKNATSHPLDIKQRYIRIMRRHEAIVRSEFGVMA